MRSASLALLVLASILAGCTTAPDAPAVPSTHVPPVAAALRAIMTDGRSPFDEAPARAIVAAAWGADAASGLGAAWRGEAALTTRDAGAATHVMGLDEAAAALLGVAPPREGDVLLSPRVAAALHASVGDRVALSTDSWPEARVARAYEMENVRSCATTPDATLCAWERASDGDVRLRLAVPPRATSVQLVPDVAELGPRDFPAYWNGTFTSPSGVVTPFTTAALDRLTMLPPGNASGALEAGDWMLRFGMEVRGERWPGALGGTVLVRAPGYAAFDFDLFRAQPAAAQTAAALANATSRERTLRVAGTLGADAPAGALLSAVDARAALGARAGEATMLVTRAAGDADALQRLAASGHADARVTALRARAWPPASPPPAGEGALVLRAPAGIDLARLPPVPGVGAVALTLEVEAPPQANDSLRDAALGPRRVLALPARGEAPWSLAPGSYWANASAAIDGIGRAPNLVLIAGDLAPVWNVSYAPLALDGVLGPQTSYAMGAVVGGPARAVWVGAPLLVAAGSPTGARVVASLAPGADAAATRDSAARAWLAWGVVPLVDPS